jgi:predicted nucleotide-binding protein
MVVKTTLPCSGKLVKKKYQERGEKMDVKVRGADPAAVKKIDELARRQNISRNLFLVNLINNYAALEEFQNFEQRYAAALEQCLNVIRQNSILLQKVLNIVGDGDET